MVLSCYSYISKIVSLPLPPSPRPSVGVRFLFPFSRPSGVRASVYGGVIALARPGRSYGFSLGADPTVSRIAVPLRRLILSLTGALWRFVGGPITLVQMHNRFPRTVASDRC